MATTRTDICPPLSRIAIAIADYLIPLTADQRDDVIVRAMCLVDDPKDRPIPYVPTEQAATEPVEPVEPMRPTSSRVAAGRKAATAEIEAAARSIVEVLSDHPEGMSKRALAVAVNLPVGEYRFKTSLDSTVNAGRIRAQGNTNSRRYMPAKQGV